MLFFSTLCAVAAALVGFLIVHYFFVSPNLNTSQRIFIYLMGMLLGGVCGFFLPMFIFYSMYAG